MRRTVWWLLVAALVVALGPWVLVALLLGRLPIPPGPGLLVVPAFTGEPAEPLCGDHTGS